MDICERRYFNILIIYRSDHARGHLRKHENTADTKMSVTLRKLNIFSLCKNSEITKGCSLRINKEYSEILIILISIYILKGWVGTTHPIVTIRTKKA